HDLAPFPTLAHIKASEAKVTVLEERWREIVQGQRNPTRYGSARLPPHPTAIIHLPMPSSPLANATTVNVLMPVVRGRRADAD
ncbi:hypothetical protein BT96DRAFT_776433, partial [Gymnopus androsaceus JB14]